MDILVTLTDWAPRAVPACGLGVLFALLRSVVRAGSLRSGGRRNTSLLIVLVVIGLALYVPAWLRFETQRAALRRAISSVSAELDKGEAEIAEIRQVIPQGPDFDRFVDAIWEAAPRVNMLEASPSAVEAQLRAVASQAGLRVQSIQHKETRPSYVESTFTIAIEGSSGAVEQFAARLSRLPRLYRIDELFLPGETGTIRISAFHQEVRPRQEHEPCLALPPPDPDPPGFLSLESDRRLLSRLCHGRGQVEWSLVNDYRTWRDLVDLMKRVRSQPTARVETEYTPARLTVGELRVVGFESEGKKISARVMAPNEKPLLLQTNDRLSDAIVTSIAKDHVIVEKQVTVAGKPPAKRQLRFAPRQELPAITLGHDTTRITAPVFARPDPRHGLPDYWAWLNQKYGAGAGVTRENNAAARLDAALGTLRGEGNTASFFGELYQLQRAKQGWRPYDGPWAATDCPWCAHLLRENETQLAAISEAVKRPRYFDGIAAGTPASAFVIPTLLPQRLAANALTARGMLLLGGEDLEGAARDALTVARLSALLGQDPLPSEQLMAVAIRGIGAHLLPALASARPLTAAHARRLLQDLRALPEMPSATDSLDRYERFHALDQILTLRLFAAERGPGAMMLQLEAEILQQTGTSMRLDPIVYLVPPEAFDWEEGLRLVNRGFDSLVAALRAGTPDERKRLRSAAGVEREDFNRRAKATLATLKKTVRSDQTASADIAEAATALGRTSEGRRELARLLVSRDEPLEFFSGGNPLRVSIAWNEADAISRLGVSTLALAVHRLEKSRYPAALDAVGSDLLPGRFAWSSPVPGYQLSYRSAAGTGAGSYAMTAVPEEFAVTGLRAFCVDSTGVLRATVDGTPPAIVNGICDPRTPVSH